MREKGRRSNADRQSQKSRQGGGRGHERFDCDHRVSRGPSHMPCEPARSCFFTNASRSELDTVRLSTLDFPVDECLDLLVVFPFVEGDGIAGSKFDCGIITGGMAILACTRCKPK